MSDWLAIACGRSTVMRSTKVALLVGAALIAINHGDAILAGDVDRGRLLKMALTVLVPYLVSTFASVGARLEMTRHVPDDERRIQ